MQTIEEYKEYCKQLEGEVKKYRDAYEASEVVNKQLVSQIKPLQDDIVRLNAENKELSNKLQGQSIELEIARQSNRNALCQLKDVMQQYNDLVEQCNKTQKEQKSCTSK